MVRYWEGADLQGYASHWVAPDFGVALERPRLLELMRSAGRRCILIAAPSGSGKTFLAATHAASSSSRILWIEARGQSLRAELVAAEVLERLVGDGRPSRSRVLAGAERPLRETVDRCLEAAFGSDLIRQGLLVVIDDLAADTDEPDRGTLQLVDLPALLSSAGVQFVITTRDAKGVTPPSESLLLGPGDLRLTADEAASAAHLTAGICGCSRSAAELLAASCGHAGLFFVMSRWAEDERPACTRDLSDAVDQWFRSALGPGCSPAERRALEALALLRRCTIEELELLGIVGARADIESMFRSLPLVSVGTGVRTEYELHDSAEQWLLAHWCQPDDGLLTRAADLLVERGDLARAVEVVATFGSIDLCLTWLEQRGSELMRAGLQRQIDDLLSRCSIGSLVARPRAIVVWADHLLRCGHPDDALTKARAAMRLAAQVGDSDTAVEAHMLMLRSFAAMDLQDRRAEEARRLRLSLDSSLSEGTRARALLEVSSCLTCSGDLEGAQSSIGEAAVLLSSGCDESARCEADLRLAMLSGLKAGDYAGASSTLASLQARYARWVTDRAVWRGNLACCLAETGRLERALGLLQYAIDRGDPYDRSAFLAVRCMVHAAMGNPSLDDDLGEALEASIDLEHSSDLATNRAYLACALRAAGRLDESLTAAERAHEVLSIVDYMGFAALAAIEVAASLVAIGDSAGARRHVEIAAGRLDHENAYHHVRHAMVVAECDRRDGRLSQAISGLRGLREEVASESSNLQIAMYCRAFPHLLGMFATALGSDQLPVHMLRMILPEYAERSLEAAMGWMDQAEWERLGVRLLGAEQFEQLKHRSGKPLCHVRMFGGLEVTIGQKVLGERDWGKRKARLLFAMIAARRGADVPREQILDQLWPDLEPERARNNFYVVWSTMKAALTPEGETPGRTCPYVESFRGRCRITRSAVRMDLDDLETAMVDLKAAEEATDIEAVLDALRRISAAYRGDFLPGDVYEECFGPLRDSYRFDFLSAMSRGAAKLIALGEPAEALVFARRGLQVDSTREDLYQLALRAHIDSGQRSAAIETFLQCRSQLVDELGLDPSAETIALYEEILAMEERTDFDSAGLAG